MLIVDDEVDATLGDLRLHGCEALPVDVELPLRAFDVAQGEHGDDLRGPADLHLFALEGEKVVHLLLSSFVCVVSPSVTPLRGVITARSCLPREITLPTPLALPGPLYGFMAGPPPFPGFGMPSRARRGSL